MNFKILLILVCIIIVAVMGTSVKAEDKNTSEKEILVVYFSLTGNTKKVAEKIADAVGGDLFEIEVVNSYPAEYKEQVVLAKKELAEGYLPALKSYPENMDKYKTVFVGSPVWWGTMSSPVRTFLSSGLLKNKKVIPFVTHGGGGADKSFEDTEKLCVDCKVVKDGWSGFRFIRLGISGWAKKNIE